MGAVVEKDTKFLINLKIIKIIIIKTKNIKT
jgi:hypothetical protein